MKKITNKTLIIAASIVMVSVIIASLVLLNKINNNIPSNIVKEHGLTDSCSEKTELKYLNGVIQIKQEKRSAFEVDTVEVYVPK